ncbi:MAG: HAD hydrolase family protein [Nitrospirota bacterium]
MKSIDSKKIKLIVYDFDGVMTDNRVYLREDGLESVVVNRSDGLAVEIIRNMGIQQIILSKEKNKVVVSRANKLGIPVLNGVDNKKEILEIYCLERSIRLSDVIYIGNDINDVGALRSVGYPMCPKDAYPEAIAAAQYILPAIGGSGVVRELLDYLK